MRKLLLLSVLVCWSFGQVSASTLDEAQKLFESGQRDQAMLKVNDYLRSNPKNPEARFLKGLILVEQGKSAAAIDVFTALTRDYPELPEPYNNIAVIHAAEGDYDSARAALQAALKTHPSYATAYENLGDIYAKLASEAYQQALDLEKRDQGQGKLKVKLSLISNLFTEEPAGQPPMVASAASSASTANNTSNPAAPAVGVIKRPESVAVTRPAAKPVEKRPTARPVISQPSVDQASLINSTIKSWASAWSAQDVTAYLSHYADSFKPARGSASSWRKQRKDRLTKPSFIRVGLDNIRLVKINEKSARIELIQTYESNTYKDKTRKRLDLVLQEGKWKINREVSI